MTDISPERAHRLARLTGVLFIITFVTSIPALLLYGPVLDDASYVLGGGADDRIFLGALLEVFLIIANVGTAVALYPVLRRRHEGVALAYVGARIVECTFIAVGVLSVLAVVTVRQDAVGDDATRVAIADALVAVKDWTFLLGPGFFTGVGTGMLLGYMLYRTNLVPRRLALFGLVGGPLVCLSGIAVLFGVLGQGGAGQFLATVPEIIWEGSLGIYLAVKGFRTSDAAVRGALPALATA
jgi:hypothetical protein